MSYRVPCGGGCGGEMNSKSRQCIACTAAERAGKIVGAPDLPAAPPPVELRADRDKRHAAHELATMRRLYEESLRTVERQERELRGMATLGAGLETYVIEPGLPSGANEATVVAVASDWHVEERVGAEIGAINNRYDLEIATARARKFFIKALRLTDLLGAAIPIKTMVLALLGDFISNDIYEEFPDINELQPIHALVMAQNLIASGIELLLANSDLDFVVPCHSGNHARTTKTTRFSCENGHSLEYLMFLHLAAYFRKEPRITFIVPEGMHSYLDVYETTIRFQHGHAIKYQGGVGGIYIPVNKAIAQWDKARRADLNVFGHFHQMRDGGNFICNGSLIGYNAFALSIKADFELPKQALFLMDKKRGRTATWPILVA